MKLAIFTNLLIVSLIVISIPAKADNPEKLFSFIERTCGEGDTKEGTRESVKGYGRAKALPSKVLKILLDSGVEIDADFSIDKVSGLINEKNIYDDQVQRRQCRKELFQTILPSLVEHILNPSVKNVATSDSVSKGFVFDARTLTPGTWLDDYKFRGFEAIGHNGIVKGNGFTSNSDETTGALDIRGFELETPSKVQISMSRCKGCDIELMSNGALVASAHTSAYGTHGNKVSLQNQGEVGIGGKQSTHVFEITEKGIRLTSNGKLVGAKRLKVEKIDQIIIRSLKREHPNIGRSYVYQVSTAELQ